MASLSNKQAKFLLTMCEFITRATNELGYKITVGEAYRPPETAALYERQGRGIANSLHTKRLAIDLNFFKGGKYITETEVLLDAGELAESLGLSWGGRFKKLPDGNHFSFEHEGVR